jgi:3-isopropylmalate/(R)-2-methylmalate dehydratase small subunit
MSAVPFNLLEGIAAPIDEANVDTNQLCPTRFNKVPRGPRFADILWHDRRFNADGSTKPDFILNRDAFRSATILVAQRNFGTGSSRETAVFGLYEFGIRCVIAPSFGDIFRGNCIKNGLLPVVLPEDAVNGLLEELLCGTNLNTTVDLVAQTVVAPSGRRYDFPIEALAKRRLLKGLDDIALTEEFKATIERFTATYRKTFDWLS